MTYYNDNDPKICAWLRDLIKAGLIPDGQVDQRSILEVRPHELSSYSQQHFFAGIGGWALALRLAEWPDERPVRTGSCPCQPFSIAGKGRAEKDERHLWPAFRGLLTFGEATITFGEQVASPLGREWLDRVRADLENLGYEVGAADLCAAGIGAPHRRQRLYWMANSNKRRRNSGGGVESEDEKLKGRDGQLEQRSRIGGVAVSEGERREGLEPECSENISERQRFSRKISVGRVVQPDSAGRNAWRTSGKITRHRSSAKPAGSDSDFRAWENFSVVECHDGKARRFEPRSFPLAYGFPNRVGLLRGYGNSIVPQIAAEFIRAAIESL